MQTIRVRDMDIPAAKLLAALHNNTLPIGLGMIHARSNMTEADAEAYLKECDGRFSFDYVHGRPIKVRAPNGIVDNHDITRYERDAGPGAFARAVAEATRAPKE